ncbi:18258_t:CDS:2 [Rhizophagus irregularis]|nr:18258_t:CDS:2 [Rhizophagus irregularis]
MSSQNRTFAFVDSNDDSKQIITMSRPIIKVPFPPVIDPYDLIVKTKDGRIKSRAPNAFIIYHKIFIETARNEGYHLPITVISSMSSQSWEKESDEVKDEYKRIAKEAYEIRNEMLPKSQRKKKRGKWNIITFDKKRTRKDNSLKIQKPIRETTELIQFSSPISFQNICPFPQSESFNKTSLSNISSPEINSQNDYNFQSSPESFSDINESPIITEEELFDLLEQVNEDNSYATNEGLGISDSIEFVPTSTLSHNSEEILFSRELIDMNAFNETNNAINATNNAINAINATVTVTEPNNVINAIVTESNNAINAWNFDYPYYL